MTELSERDERNGRKNKEERGGGGGWGVSVTLINFVLSALFR